MPFHIADFALPPRAVIHKVNSQDDPYHENHRLLGDILLSKLNRDKRSILKLGYIVSRENDRFWRTYMNSALWNSIISFLQRRSDNPSNEMEEPPWCLLLVKDPSSLEATIAEDEQSGSILNEMTYLQKRTWLSRIRIWYVHFVSSLKVNSRLLYNSETAIRLPFIIYELSCHPCTSSKIFKKISIPFFPLST
jgi:hypothetical protein